MAEFNPKLKTFIGTIESIEQSDARFSKSVRLTMKNTSGVFIHTLLTDLSGNIISRNGIDTKVIQATFKKVVKMPVDETVEIQAFQNPFKRQLYGIYSIARLNN